jgi:hypothetical protein
LPAIGELTDGNKAACATKSPVPPGGCLPNFNADESKSLKRQRRTFAEGSNAFGAW